MRSSGPPVACLSPRHCDRRSACPAGTRSGPPPRRAWTRHHAGPGVPTAPWAAEVQPVGWSRALSTRARREGLRRSDRVRRVRRRNRSGGGAAARSDGARARQPSASSVPTGGRGLRPLCHPSTSPPPARPPPRSGPDPSGPDPTRRDRLRRGRLSLHGPMGSVAVGLSQTPSRDLLDFATKRLGKGMLALGKPRAERSPRNGRAPASPRQRARTRPRAAGLRARGRRLRGVRARPRPESYTAPNVNG
jgi:hypothetical protein